MPRTRRRGGRSPSEASAPRAEEAPPGRDPDLVADDKALLDLCERLRSEAAIAVDTEFLGEGRRVPDLCLIQVATKDQVWLIDPMNVKSLVPVFALFEDTDVEKVFHAGEQDVRILEAHGCHAVEPLFDTQIAAGFVGFGVSVGLQHLVKQELGAKLPKGTGFTDWRKRPLPKEDKTYAGGDVEHLLALREKLLMKLDAQRRTAWVRSYLGECVDRWREPRDTSGRLQALGRKNELSPPEFGALVALDEWREAESKRGNKPVKRITNDDALLEIARQNPQDLRELGNIRTLNPGLVRRAGRDILKAAARGRAHPQTPEKPPRPEHVLNEHEAALAEAVRLAVRTKLAVLGIADQFFANEGQIKALVGTAVNGGTVNDTPLGQGWRGEVAGDWLQGFLDGTMVVGIVEEEGRKVPRMRGVGDQATGRNP